MDSPSTPGADREEVAGDSTGGEETRWPLPDFHASDPRLPPPSAEPALPPPPPYSPTPAPTRREPGDGEEGSKELGAVGGGGAQAAALTPATSGDQQASPLLIEPAGTRPRPQEKSKRWTPNPELVDQITALGFSPVAAEKALFYTNNGGADVAVGWILDNPSASDDSRPLDLEGYSSADSDSDLEEHTGVRARRRLRVGAEAEAMLGATNKMVLVVNAGLKMGLGKVAAQVGHGTLGIYRKILHSGEAGAEALAVWDAEGEVKVVVRGETDEHLRELQGQARDLALPTYLVQDAGRTQIAAGSTTVLAIFGPTTKLDSVTGKLKLL